MKKNILVKDYSSFSKDDLVTALNISSVTDFTVDEALFLLFESRLNCNTRQINYLNSCLDIVKDIAEGYFSVDCTIKVIDNLKAENARILSLFNFN